MLQLTVLTGQKAGTRSEGRRFPFVIGRAPSSSLVLEDPGVWERHLEIHWAEGGLCLVTGAEALASLNGEPVREGRLRDGDILELGSVKLRFGLSPMRQGGLYFREVLTWVALAVISLGQVAIVYLLS